MAATRVTVAIPAYNAARTIGQTLDSVLRQTHADTEIVVSDNHSDDGTLPLVERDYGPRGVRALTCPAPIRDASYEDAMPVIDNFNSVLEYGTGPYIAIYHADDIYDATIVARQVAVLDAHPDVGAVFTMGRSIDVHGRAVSVTPPRVDAPGGIAFFRLGALVDAVMRFGSFLMTPTFMARRSVLATVGPLRREYGQAADYDWWFRFADRAVLAVIDEPLFSRRLSATQDSYRGRDVYRTAPLPLFALLDDCLARGDVAACVTPSARAAYRVARAGDRLRIARNLLAAGEDDRARSLLHFAFQDLATRGAMSSRGFLVGTTAVGLLVGSRLGVGARVAELHDRLGEIRRGRASWRGTKGG
jgi:glycosyltransferase involved in cell wall biosynthesis